MTATTAVHISEQLDPNDPRQYYFMADDKLRHLHEWIAEYVEPCRIQSAKNDSISSYELKHLYERNGGTYITNGVMKKAMEMAGFQVYNRGKQNWNFNVGRKVFKQVDPVAAEKLRLQRRGYF